jgi:hypothetical protein
MKLKCTFFLLLIKLQKTEYGKWTSDKESPKSNSKFFFQIEALLNWWSLHLIKKCAWHQNCTFMIAKKSSDEALKTRNGAWSTFDRADTSLSPIRLISCFFISSFSWNHLQVFALSLTRFFTLLQRKVGKISKKIIGLIKQHARAVNVTHSCVLLCCGEVGSEQRCFEVWLISSAIWWCFGEFVRFSRFYRQSCSQRCFKDHENVTKLQKPFQIRSNSKNSSSGFHFTTNVTFH